MNADSAADPAAPLERIARTPRLLVACDYDGVLAPLVDDPAAAYPLASSIESLRALSALPQTFVALLSGRALAELTELSGMAPPVSLVGSHGAEWSSGNVEGLDAAREELLGELAVELDRIARRYDGVAVEAKPASVVLHVRRASRADAAAAVSELADGPLQRAGLKVTHGKEIVEVAVVAADKGSALMSLRSSVDVDAVLFVGDDVTDEDAFARLIGDDVGIKVGPGQSLATLRVDDPDAVSALLADLVALRTGLR